MTLVMRACNRRNTEQWITLSIYSFSAPNFDFIGRAFFI
ncbi:hypothetical protein K661_02547 [Piscirickettsia salmonis LF-89 = ATCC VR-1361]|nr:hypothetical protein K661_02547 [Piscirickettsia salmonis LF-89 = ATCC VR-1361]